MNIQKYLLLLKYFKKILPFKNYIRDSKFFKDLEA